MVVEHVTIRKTPYGRRLDCTLDGREATFWTPELQMLIMCGFATKLDLTKELFYCKEAYSILAGKRLGGN